MRVKLIGVSNAACKCESMPRRTMASAHESGVIAARENDANLRHGQRLCRRVDEFGRFATRQESVTSPGEMISQESTENLSAKLEYPACLVCGSDRREVSVSFAQPVQCRALYNLWILLSLPAGYRRRDARSVSPAVILRRRCLWLRGHELHGAGICIARNVQTPAA